MFRIYLAGPIAGCSDEQRRHWREVVKQRYGRRCDFLDPVENLVSPEASPYEVVDAEIRAIEGADGVLVNMWRESIGSALGAVHGHRNGRPVVIADPNRLRNRMLTFYADAVAESPLRGAKVLLDLLQAESRWRVIRSGAREEPFQRHKLTTAIQDASRRAGRDDIVVPCDVLPEVIERLNRTDRQMQGLVTTKEINETVAAVLTERAADPGYADRVSGILAEWHRRESTGLLAPTDPPVRAMGRTEHRETEVPISSRRHETIWGKSVEKLRDVRSPEAREVFQNIAASVSGITAIKLGRRSRGGLRNTCGATIQASSMPFVINGQLFDRNARAGTVQHFQVRVQFDDEKPRIAAAIEERLRSIGRWVT